jgi:serine/threonine protein kinase
VVLWELLVGQTPWAGYHDFFIYQAVRNGQTKDYLRMPDSAPDRLKQLIQRCWSVEPSERPSASECVSEIEQIILQGTPVVQKYDAVSTSCLTRTFTVPQMTLLAC